VSILPLWSFLDTVDHSILLRRLRLKFGIDGLVHQQFESYLSSRKQYVRRGPSRSSVTYLTRGVPQGSVIGPILFVLYTVDLLSVIHNYMDCAQICMPMTPRFMVHASKPWYLHSLQRSLNVSRQLHHGCNQIGFSLIQTKLKCCGA